MRHPFDSQVDELRVSVAVTDSAGTDPDEVFVIWVSPGQPTEPLDLERSVSELLKPILVTTTEPGDYPPAPHSLRVERRSTSWGASFNVLHISLEIQSFINEVAAAFTVDLVKHAFAKIAAFGAEELEVKVDQDALHAATQQIVLRYRDVSAEDLQLISIEHDLTIGRWIVSLRSALGVTYEVELGFVKGLPSTKRIKRIESS